MFGMALTRPRHWQGNWWVVWTSSRMCAGKGRHFEQLLWQYSATWRETFQFLSNVSLFLDCVFWKLPQFHTSDFRKVVRQHTEGMVGSITWVLLEIYLAFQQWKNFENPLRIDKPIAMSLVCNFFCGHPVFSSVLYHFHFWVIWHWRRSWPWNLS